MIDPAGLLQLISDPQWKEHVFVLHSHNPEGEAFVALGKEDEFVCEELKTDTISDLQKWLDSKRDWVFGFLAYDLKNAIENLESRHPNNIGFPVIHFIRPLVVLKWKGTKLTIEKSDGTEGAIENLLRDKIDLPSSSEVIRLQPRIEESAYIAAVEKLRDHIQQGDIYEVNYCQEFFAVSRLENPYLLWLKLNSYTEAPFSAYFKIKEKYLLSASPERFLKKKEDKIISQPIKGTIKRGKTSEEDEALKKELSSSQKERSENIMIVDLVRNDLSHFAERGTVNVEELCGIHTFKTVHHMISTVSAEVKKPTSFTDILRATFPMGSMTGAPKIRAMELIEEHEYNRRGIYSGSVGYITPDGDFDFNVVIRSLVYNEEKPYISCCVGSAITSLSNAQSEYQECLLKAEALFKALSGSNDQPNTTSSASQMAPTAS